MPGFFAIHMKCISILFFRFWPLFPLYYSNFAVFIGGNTIGAILGCVVNKLTWLLTKGNIIATVFFSIIVCTIIYLFFFQNKSFLIHKIRIKNFLKYILFYIHVKENIMTAFFTNCSEKLFSIIIKISSDTWLWVFQCNSACFPEIQSTLFRKNSAYLSGAECSHLISIHLE